ncbi:GNAT family N-acetyltransferase [Solicola sp. PLA-1-18]|uniref:GNAT family N-acetyltransferase n=1 Tax=Solicola sp. PLA-1-18 TaxID=3380532 RepID=UPI003B76EDD9
MRPLQRADASAWARLHRESREWLTPWEATLPEGSLPGAASFRQMVRGLRAQARDGRSLPFVTTYDGQMVGQVTVSGVTWGSARWAQVGYWIDRSHAGRGITPIAVAMVVDHCLSAVGLHRIEIAIRPENVASLAIVHKLGLRQVGLAPKYLHIDGAWRDHLLFAVTAEEAPRGLLARLLEQPADQA